MQFSISRCQGSTGSANRYEHDVDLSFPPRHVLERDIAEPRCREKFCPKSQGLLAVRAAALLTEMWTTEVDLIDGDALELSSRTVFVVSHCTWWCQMPCQSRACAHEAFSQTTNRPPFNHAPAERRSPSPRWFRRARWIWCAHARRLHRHGAPPGGHRLQHRRSSDPWVARGITNQRL